MASAGKGYKCPLIKDGAPCPGVLEPGAIFCPKCGGQSEAPIMARLCPKCQSPVKPEDNFCCKCGLPLNDIVFDNIPAQPSPSEGQAAGSESQDGGADQAEGATAAPPKALDDPEVLSVASAGSSNIPGRRGASAQEARNPDLLQVRNPGLQSVYADSLHGRSMPSVPSIDSGYSQNGAEAASQLSGPRSRKLSGSSTLSSCRPPTPPEDPDSEKTPENSPTETPPPVVPKEDGSAGADSTELSAGNDGSKSTANNEKAPQYHDAKAQEGGASSPQGNGQQNEDGTGSQITGGGRMTPPEHDTPASSEGSPAVKIVFHLLLREFKAYEERIEVKIEDENISFATEYVWRFKKSCMVSFETDMQDEELEKLYQHGYKYCLLKKNSTTKLLQEQKLSITWDAIKEKGEWHQYDFFSRYAATVVNRSRMSSVYHGFQGCFQSVKGVAHFLTSRGITVKKDEVVAIEDLVTYMMDHNDVSGETMVQLIDCLLICIITWKSLKDDHHKEILGIPIMEWVQESAKQKKEIQQRQRRLAMGVAITIMQNKGILLLTAKEREAAVQLLVPSVLGTATLEVDGLVNHHYKQPREKSLCHEIQRFLTPISEGQCFLSVVPLLHFLSGESQPRSYQKEFNFQDSLEHSWWGTSKFGPKFLPKFQESCRKMRMNEMTKLNKLFEIDPLLGRSVLMALGLDASHKLLGKRITRHEILCAVYHQIVYGGDYARNLVEYAKRSMRKEQGNQQESLKCAEILHAIVERVVDQFRPGDQTKFAGALSELITAASTPEKTTEIVQQSADWCKTVFSPPKLTDFAEDNYIQEFFKGFNRLLQVPFQSAEIEALFHGHLSACLVCYMNEVPPMTKAGHWDQVFNHMQCDNYDSKLLTMIQESLPEDEHEMREAFETFKEDQQKRKTRSSTLESGSRDNVTITFNLIVIGKVTPGAKLDVHYQDEHIIMEKKNVTMNRGKGDNFCLYTASLSIPKYTVLDGEQKYNYFLQPKRGTRKKVGQQGTVDMTGSSGMIYQYDTVIINEPTARNEKDSLTGFIQSTIRIWLNELKFLPPLIRNFDHHLGKLNKCSSSWSLLDEAEQSQCFKEVLQDFLGKRVSSLTAGGSDQAGGLHGKAVALINASQKYGIQLAPSEVTSLCKALLPRPQDKSCYGDINDSEFVVIALSLVRFMESSIESTKGDAAVLCCIPLLHFVRKQSEPFKSPQLKWGKKTWWGVDGLERAIELFQHHQGEHTIDPTAVIKEMKDYFRVDELLGRTICQFLGPDHIPRLLPEIDLPLHAVLGTFVYHAEKGYFNTENFRGIYGKLEKRVEQTIQTTSCAQNEMKTSSEVALALIEFLAKSDKNYLDVLSAIEIAGIILGSMVTQPSPKVKTKSLMDTYRDQVVNWLTEWLRHAPADSDELRVWQTLLKVVFPDDKEDKQWQATIRQKLGERNKQRSNDEKISIYIESERCGYPDGFLKRCIKQCADDATKEEMPDEMRGLNLFRHTDCMGYVHMLSSVWINLYPMDLSRTGNTIKPEVVFQVLKQPYLTEFLEMYASDRTRDYLNRSSQDSLILMTGALKKLKEHLKDNSVNKNMLEEVKKMQESIGKAMRCAGLMKNPSDEATLTQLIRDCQEKMRCFEGHREHVATFLMFLRMTENDIEPGEIEALEGRLAKRYQNIPLSTMSGEQNSFYNIPSNLMNVLPKMQELKDCRVFRRIWKMHLHQKSLCLSDVEEMVWIPSMKEWEVVKQKLKEGSLELTAMKALLSDIPESRLRQEIKWMLPGCPEQLVNDRLEGIHIHHQVSKQALAAERIMDMRQSYNLTGNFEVIEDIINADKSGDATLSSMTKKILEAGEKLAGLSELQLSSLNAFRQSHALVQWIHQNVPKIEQLKVIVDRGLIAADCEGELEVTKVTHLDDVVRGFAPLIYKLETSSGFEDLFNCWKEVWPALDNDKNLPNKLILVNSDLEWLKRLKSIDRTVEVSTLQEVDAINRRGIYCIGRKETMKFKVEDIIRVEVKKGEGIHHKRSYSFEDLKLLQSKLMLIAGKKQKQKHDFTRFMEIFDGVTLLAKTFIDVCTSGSILFKDWTALFFCNEEIDVNVQVNFGLSQHWESGTSRQADVTKQIIQIREFMEECREEWKEYVSTKRKEFPELNHYTTEQLVMLRSALASMTAANQEPSPEVLALLHDVCPNCSKEDLKRAVSAALEKINVTKDSTADMDENEDAVEPQETDPLISKLLDNGFSRKVINQVIDTYGRLDYDEMEWRCFDIEDEEEKRKKDFKSVQEGYSLSATTQNDPDQQPESARLKDRLKGLWEKFLSSSQRSMKDYLSIEHLGMILECLKSRDPLERTLPTYLKRGQPNLIVCPQNELLQTVLSLYMEDDEATLPTRKEVLLCTEDTTAEEVELLLLRAIQDRSGRIYTLAQVDLLRYEVATEVEKLIEKKTQGETQYQVVLVCSAEGQSRSLLTGAVILHRVNKCEAKSVENVRSFIKKRLATNKTDHSHADPERLSARLVTSDRAGNGKTLWTKRCLGKMSTSGPARHSITLPLFGRSAKARVLLNALLPHSASPSPRVFHIDIQHEINQGVDHLLFNLVILGSLVDPRGFIWHRSNKDYYVIEIMPLKNWEIGVNEPKGIRYQNVHSVLDLLPMVKCHSPKESLGAMKTFTSIGAIKAKTLDQYFDLETYESERYQRVTKHLVALTKGPAQGEQDPAQNEPTKTVPASNPDKKKPARAETLHKMPRFTLGDVVTSLETCMGFCGHVDPSWSELECFIRFLSTQLELCEKSIFLDTDIVEDTLPNFREFVTRFMLQMSKDFSTRSIDMAEESPTDEPRPEENEKETDELSQFQLKRRWESSPHPYIFFNPDQTLTFLGFKIDEKNMNLMDPDNNTVLEEKILEEALFYGLKANAVDLSEDFKELSRENQLEKLCRVMGNGEPHDPDVNYVLTSDNVKKMMAIQMRFRCKIPVIVMGETGCGKTHLIKFMCRLQNPKGSQCKNMTLMKIHGGTTLEEVQKKIESTEELAFENRKRYPHMFTVLFLDEVNTTESLGLVKEVMCDGSINGRPLKAGSGLRLIAACNPYRRHSEEVIKNLEKAGLGYHVCAENTNDTLGRIPMRRLVYRVQPLPQSMLPLVWDFGQILERVEQLYIEQIVIKKLSQMELSVRESWLGEALKNILVTAQKFMREQGDACSFVSLRDVERCMSVFEWFYLKRNILLKGSDANLKDCLVRCIMLSLGVCYFVSLQQKRQKFLDVLQTVFDKFWKDRNFKKEFESIVEGCQDLFLQSMKIGENIAKNKALKENVFIMIVCIDLRIPLFLVGKPGCSKSLAKNIVLNNMDGSYSLPDLLKTFKKVQMASYQCSPLSTSDGIISTFRQCASFQKERDLDKHVAVVVLDEVGLAEDSEKMPLKALHSLLEDGSHEDEEAEKHKKVGFIGISNWALDPAKMNRGILVQREVPDMEELTKTAKGMSSGGSRDVAEFIDPLMKPLSQAYFDLFDKAIEMRREFYGLRDFYSLVKMVYGFAEEKRDTPSWPQLEHAILRNFGGLSSIQPAETFSHHLAGQIEKKIASDDPVNTPKGLLSASLESNQKWDSRYLLLLTESNVALPIIQRNFECMRSAIVIYGSAFPKDQEYTVVCRDINRIKMCMEAGQPVILLHMENLHASLYDLLNMHYADYGGVRLVDIGLGTHRVKTRIQEGFRVYVVAEKEHVYNTYPIPLINRLEKHVVEMSIFLTGKHSTIVGRIERWASAFISQRTPWDGTNLELRDVFIGYHKDTPTVLVSDISWTEHEDDDQAVERVFKEAQLKLLQCATPEAIVRTATATLATGESVSDIYCKEQQHESLKEYVIHKFLKKRAPVNHFVQVTTFSSLLSMTALAKLTEDLKKWERPHNLTSHSLQTFETEQQFSNLMRKWFDNGGDTDQILILQCDSGDQNEKLIACARHIIHAEQQYDPQAMENPTHLKHVILIVKLPRVKGGCFNGFEGGLWESLHLDDLSEPQHMVPPIFKLMELKASEVLACGICASESDDQEDPAEKHKQEFDLTHLVYISIHGAASMVRNEEDPKVTTAIVRYMMDVFSPGQKSDSQIGFRENIKQRLPFLMAEKEEKTMMSPKNWFVKDVASVQAISKAGTLRRSLWLYLESKITLLLAGLIAYFNTNNNMKLIMEENETWITDMWVRMAQNVELTPMEYADLRSSKEGEELKEVVVQMTGCSGMKMDGALPFSWIIKETLDQIIEAHIQGVHHEDMSWISEVGQVLTRTHIWPVLKPAFEDGGRQKVQSLYLDDFVRMIYRPKSKKPNEECQLVKLAILSTMRGMLSWRGCEYEDLESVKEEEILLMVHAAATAIQGRLQLFSQVLECRPDTIEGIIKSESNEQEADLRNMTGTSEMTLDILTVHLVVNSVQPDRKLLRNLEKGRRWLEDVERLAPLINDVLSRSKDIQHSGARLYGEKCLQALGEISTNWNRVYAVKMFADIICPKGSDQEEDITKTCPKLWQILQNSNFKSKATMVKVLEVVQLATKITCQFYEGNIPKCRSCNNTLLHSYLLPCGHHVCVTCTDSLLEAETCTCLHCKEEFKKGEEIMTNHGEREAKEKAADYKSRCRIFFVEMVSRMCFAEDTSPDDDMIQMLLDLVTGQQAGEQKAPDAGDDKSQPVVDIRLDLTTQVIRSVLLQHLIRKCPEKVQNHLKAFFEAHIAKAEDTSKDLAIIYCQSLEDSIHNLMVSKDKNKVVDEVITLINQSADELLHSTKDGEQPVQDDASQAAEENPAEESAADEEQQNDTTQTAQETPAEDLKIVFEKIKAIAHSRVGLDYAAGEVYRRYVDDEDEEAPDAERITDLLGSVEKLCQKDETAGYLTRVIAKRFGQDALQKIQENLPWIIPEYARPKEDGMIPDPLIVCGKNYKRTRECLALFLTDLNKGPINEVVDAIQDVIKRRDFLLSIYREVTSVHFSTTTKSPSQEGIGGIRAVLQGKPTVEGMHLAEPLLDNALNGNCPHLKAEPGGNQAVVDIIVHFGIAISVLPEAGATGLFKLLISQPASMKNCLLPTMPEDNRAEIFETMRQAAGAGDNPTLHECKNGHPYFIGECGRAWTQRDCPTCGVPIGGRLHSLAANNTKIDKIQDQTKPGHCLGEASERSQVMEMERDLTPASTALLRLLVHLSLYVGTNAHIEAVHQLIHPELGNKEYVPDFLWHHILYDLNQIQRVTGKSKDDCALLIHLLLHKMSSSPDMPGEVRLETKTTRRAWENTFASTYIKPILEDIDRQLLDANQSLTEDERVGSRAPLLKIINETETPTEPVCEITRLPAMWRYRVRVTLENLAMKLCEEQQIEKKYSVLEWFLKKEEQLRVVQQLPNIVRFVLMASQFYHRKAGRDKVENDRIDDYIEDIQKEQKKQEVRKLFQYVCEAWKKVLPHLSQHVIKGVRAIPERFCKLEMNEDTPMTALLPNDRGKGQCMRGLLHYLMTVHNQFMSEFCRISHNFIGPEVSLKDVNLTHLIAYHPERDLLPLIAAHCNYSLEVRYGTKIEYNFASLEQQLKDRFIAGKASLKYDIDNVVFCEDLSNAKLFETLHKKIPQVELSSPVQAEIRKDYRYITELDDCLSTIYKTLGFTVTIGGKAETPLVKFMTETLQMDEGILSRKVRQRCKLKHTRALWLLLSLEREKLVARHKQEPFTSVDASNYRKPLDIEQKRELEQGLQHIQCDVLLARLYEFIVLHVTVKQDVDDDDYVDNTQHPLGMYLAYYLENLAVPEIPALTDGTFPESILVEQCVNAWLVVNAYTGKQK